MEDVKFRIHIHYVRSIISEKLVSMEVNFARVFNKDSVIISEKLVSMEALGIVGGITLQNSIRFQKN